jgi:hypothetical protein
LVYLINSQQNYFTTCGKHCDLSVRIFGKADDFALESLLFFIEFINFDFKSEVHSQSVNCVYTFRLTVVGVKDSTRYSISETAGI